MPKAKTSAKKKAASRKEKQAALFAEDQYDEEEDEGGEEEEGGSGWEAVLDAVRSCELTADEIPDFCSALREIANELDPAADDEEEYDDEDEDEEEDALDDMDEGTPIAEQEKVEGGTMADAKYDAKAHAELAALRSQVSRMQKRERKKATIQKAKAAIGNRGFEDAELNAELQAAYKSGGAPAVQAFVKAAQHLPESPGLDPEWTQEAAYAGGEVPEVLATYTAPLDMQAAREAYASLQAQQDAGYDLTEAQIKSRIARHLANERKARS